MIDFKKRILFVGFGGVAECTLPILFKHIKVPAKNVTVMDFAEVKGKLKYFAVTPTRFRTSGSRTAEALPTPTKQSRLIFSLLKS